jgi:hypothetical protein
MKTIKEMMKEVSQMKRSGKDEVWFDATENLGIFVEVVDPKDDELEIAIELRDIDTNDTKESVVCNYNDDNEIESSLDYIRACV